MDVGCEEMREALKSEKMYSLAYYLFLKAGSERMFGCSFDLRHTAGETQQKVRPSITCYTNKLKGYM